MIEGAEITIYGENDETVSLDLTPIQLEIIVKILGLRFEKNSFSCFSDESLKTILSMIMV